MPDTVIDINHAPGTRVSIKQLFYNTPARRKFLRAERTEYRHCDDVIKRMALARFDVGFYVNHNGRQTLKLPAVKDDMGRARRIAQVCGESFIKQAIVIDFPHSDMRLWGWVSQAGYSRQTTDLQYFYINGRIIRDRVINHAIRSAYQHVLPVGRHAAYVLHLEVDPATVDVNVHPTKHEVRFRESRRIHDFISRSLRDAIQHISPSSPSYESSTVTDDSSTEEHAYPANLGEQNALYQPQTDTRFGALLTIIQQRFALTQQQQHIYLLDLQLATAYWVASQWHEAFVNKKIKTLPLLIPERLSLSQAELDAVQQDESGFNDLGFEFGLTDNNDLLIRKIPSLFQCYSCIQLVKQLLNTTVSIEPQVKQIAILLSQLTVDYKKLDLTLLFSAIDSSDEYTDYWREITQADLSTWLAS